MAEEKMVCGCKISTLVKLINMILGVLMIVESFFSFFTVVFDILSESAILIICFKVYEM